MIDRILRKKKLGEKLTYIFICGVGLQLLLFVLFLLIFYHFNLKTNFERERESVLNEICQSLEQEIQYVDNTSISILCNDDVRNYLSQPDHTAYYSEIAKKSLYQYIYRDQYIESIYLIRCDNEYVSINYTGMDATRRLKLSSEWIKTMSELRGKSLVGLNGSGAIFTSQNHHVLSYMRAVFDINTQKQIGYMIINVSMEFFNHRFKTLNDDNLIFIGALDLDHGEYVAAYKKNQVSAFNYSKEFQKPLENWNISIVYITEMELWNSLSKSLIVYILLFFIIMLITLMLFSSYISATVTGPIATLANSMRKVKEGKLYRVSLKTADDEIGELKDTYNEMLIEMNRLIDTLVNEEKEKNQLELRILQEQINPHFLYNTLANIEYEALKNQDMKTYQQLQILSRFYRNVLSDGSQIITIEREVQIAKDYLELQKMRFGDLFEAEFIVADEVKQFYIPKLILQPLVENSLLHGIYPSGEKGIISVEIRQDHKNMVITLNDSGIGIDIDKVKKLLTEKEKQEHFGLKGTLDRLHYYYNIDDFYTIESEAGEYTRIIITIPIRPGGDNE